MMCYSFYKEEVKKLLERWNLYRQQRGYIKDVMCEPLVECVEMHAEMLGVMDAYPYLRDNLKENLENLKKALSKLIVMQEELH